MECGRCEWRTAANWDSRRRRNGRGQRGCGWRVSAGREDAPALTGEQERVLLEHLPIVRFLARRIHERLPQHVDIEDLVSAGWWA